MATSLADYQRLQRIDKPGSMGIDRVQVKSKGLFDSMFRGGKRWEDRKRSGWAESEAEFQVNQVAEEESEDALKRGATAPKGLASNILFGKSTNQMPNGNLLSGATGVGDPSASRRILLGA